MKSTEVYKSARSFNHNHDHKFENVFIFNWESDLFSVTSTKYSVEIEVKVSRSDFFADFKKAKHFLLSRHKHKLLTIRESWDGENFSAIHVTDVQKSIPNRFYFCCPFLLISALEVPEYAGLIYAKENGDYLVVRPAPLLHKEKFDYKRMLFDKYMWGYMNAKNEIYDLNRSLKFMRDQYDDTITLKPNFISLI